MYDIARIFPSLKGNGNIDVNVQYVSVCVSVSNVDDLHYTSLGARRLYLKEEHKHSSPGYASYASSVLK